MKTRRYSFSALVHRVAGTDVPATTLLKELLGSGAVRRRQDGKLEALQRSYIPQTMDEQLIRLWGSVMADLATTYAHNLTRAPGKPTRFERAPMAAAKSNTDAPGWVPRKAATSSPDTGRVPGP